MVLDLALFERHRCASPPSPLPGCYVNWLGLQTEAELFLRPELAGQLRLDLPFGGGGDGVYGGAHEYASFLTAIDTCKDKAAFTAVELGAGWGPWISGVGKVCQGLGFRDITLVGVEADEGRCELMRRHLARNGLSGVPGVTARCLHGAAWSEDTVLQFPVIDPRDHGGAATAEIGELDYRGKKVDHIDVPAFSLSTICKGLGRIDYMHWDIQGAELAVAKGGIEFMSQNVAYVFIGTHSRAIESGLIDLFFAYQWDIVYERPCHIVYDRRRISVENMLHTDGDMFVRNPRLVEN